MFWPIWTFTLTTGFVKDLCLCAVMSRVRTLTLAGFGIELLWACTQFDDRAFALTRMLIEFLWWSTILRSFANTTTNFVAECFTSWARLSFWANTTAEVIVEYKWWFTAACIFCAATSASVVIKFEGRAADSCACTLALAGIRVENLTRGTPCVRTHALTFSRNQLLACWTLSDWALFTLAVFPVEVIAMVTVMIPTVSGL